MVENVLASFLPNVGKASFPRHSHEEFVSASVHPQIDIARPHDVTVWIRDVSTDQTVQLADGVQVHVSLTAFACTGQRTQDHHAGRYLGDRRDVLRPCRTRLVAHLDSPLTTTTLEAPPTLICSIPLEVEYLSIVVCLEPSDPCETVFLYLVRGEEMQGADDTAP